MDSDSKAMAMPIVRSNGASPLAKHLDKYHTVLASLPLILRPGLTGLWGDIRATINEQSALIMKLSQLSNKPVAVLSRPLVQSSLSAERPRTSESVDLMREAIQVSLEEEALRTLKASETIEEIHLIDPAWALKLLQKHTTRISSIGCWFSDNQPNHPNGYTKLNLRGTPHPSRSGKFKCQPFFHQLAVIASGRGIELLLTSDGLYQVS